MLHRPLARMPENTLKFAVGIMLSAFGTYWLGEGYGVLAGVGLSDRTHRRVRRHRVAWAADEPA
jgi:hypothetical protein